ncbi:MAG: hypothetical protein ACOVP1_06620 [Bacteroidia bacterium]
MYSILLSSHNLLRWAFLAVAILAIFKAINGLRGNHPFTPGDKKLGGILVGLAHSQLLIGIILWFISPNVQAALADMGVAMKDKIARLQLLEHPLTMIIAVALIQIGRIKSKKAYADADKHKRSLVFYGIALVLILSRIPWAQSPLFRFEF